MIKLHALHATKFKQLDDLRVNFPERGSVLIQGLNEAGKSTLFESIYFALFGKALATEDNAGRLEDLVHYQAPRAFVRLAFSTEQARFTVDRTLHRGRPNAAALEVAYNGGRTEVVTNLTAVNRRITEELGVDAEALLNSCFVEQKKLEKLEGMPSQQRRDTLLKLLNLEKLARLEAQYRTGPADDAELRQRRDRLALAQAQRELPLLEGELRTTESRLAAIAAHKLLGEQVAQRAIVVREGERQQELATRTEQLRAELRRLAEVQHMRDGAKRIGEAATALLQEQGELTVQRQELEVLRQRAAALPELELEAGRLDALVELLEQLDRADQALVAARQSSAHLAEVAVRWEADREQLADYELQLAAAEQSAAAVAGDLAAANLRERLVAQFSALREWCGVQELAAAAQASQRELDGLQAEADARQAGLAELASQLRHQNRARAAFGVLALGLLAAGVVLAALVTPLALVVALGAALPAWLWRHAAAEVARLGAGLRVEQAGLDEVRSRWHRTQGERDLAHRSGADPARLAELEAALAAAEVARPASLAAARDELTAREARLATLPPLDAADLQRRQGELEAQQRTATEHIARLSAELNRAGDAGARAAEAQAALQARREDVAAARRQVLRQAGARQLEGPAGSITPAPTAGSADEGEGSHEQAEWGDGEAAVLGSLPELPATRDALDDVRGRGQLAREARRQLLEREKALQQRGERLAARVGDMCAQIAELGPAAQTFAADLPKPQQGSEPVPALAEVGALLQAVQNASPRGGAPGDPEPAVLEALLDASRALWRAATQRLAALDEPELRRDAAAASEEMGAAAERLAHAERELKRLGVDLGRLGVAEEVALAEEVEGEAALNALRTEQVGQVASVAAHRQELEQLLHLGGVQLNAADEDRAVAELQERIAVHGQAHRIVALARKSIVAKVLPSTVRNMRLLLPLLTQERYRDVEITDDYRIRVWDESARALKAKDIFSGGTRDQLSLALRLAFALATLPEELGSAPAFIFLDEPLSSFDQARTEALVGLLTRGGLIAESFDQIFVISHSQSFDPELFDYHLELEGGRVVASDLPEDAAVAALQPELMAAEAALTVA